MLLDGGAWSGRGEAGSGAGRGVPTRTRARRRQAALQEMATPVAATFLGLLLIDNLAPALARARPQEHGATSSDGHVLGLDDAAFQLLPEPSAVLAPSEGPDSAGGAGQVGLGGMAGASHQAVIVASGDDAHGAPGGSGGAAGQPALGPAAAGAALTFASLPEPVMPTGEDAAAGASDDEDLGPIGRYVRGNGDGKTVLTDGDDIFIGSDGNEHVVGGAGDDHIDGAGGDDHLEGGTGDDELLGGGGDDILDGLPGYELIDGGSGDDELLGGSGDDELLGGGGDDYLNGGSGIDRLAGGTGDEILVLADVRDAVTELGLGADAGGNDTVVVTQSYAESLASALADTGGRATFVLGRPDIADFPTGVAGFRQQIDPDIENIRLEGKTAHDVVGDDHGSLIVGNAGANRIHAGGGDDAVYGGAGNDLIDAGAGNDWLEGGLGDDTLWGGAGDDVYVLGLQESGDTVFDHEGRNSLRLIGADPARLSLDLRGDDLLVSHAGKVVATVSDYAGSPDSIVGIDLGQGVRPLEDFMPAATAKAAARTTASGDWLAEYTPAPGLAEPLPEPWASLDPRDAAAPVPAAGNVQSSVAADASATFSTSFAALPSDHAAADLWAPMDDGMTQSGDEALRQDTARHSSA
ncbi:MAG: calcium-binding protein [Geminicoccaceae bacterium]